MSTTIFLSTVTNELGRVRGRLAAVCGRTKRLIVRHQDDFVQRGVLTLQVLEEEVRQSDVVVHVIGAECGAAPPVEQVEDLLHRLHDFETKFPEVAARARRREVSYTQWEAWLALYFASLVGSDMRLCSYEVVESQSRRETQQVVHLELLRKRKIYPHKVAPGCEPVDEVLLSLIELGFLTEEEGRRIVQLPYPSIGALFKGREAFLERLRESLRRRVGGRATAITGKAVHGLGGVGKTRLAVEYAWQFADEYSAVLFVTADSPENLRQNLAELAGPLVLNLPEQTAPEEEVRVGATLRWLREHPEWLLILDNVDTEIAADAVKKRLAQLHGGQILITSRLGTFSGSIEPMELDVLDAAAAAQFLLERTRPQSDGRGRRLQPTDEVAAADLAKELDGLALALEQASAYICRNRISLAEYLKQCRSHQVDVQKWHDGTMQYPKSVAVMWQTTLDQLSVEEVVLLKVLAWLAPEPIPLFVLTHLSIETLTSLFPSCLTASAAESKVSKTETVANQQEENTDDVLHLLPNLADYGMIRWDTQGETISVHRVVQEILRTRQPQPIQVLTAALQMLAAARPEGDPGDVRTWPQWNPLRPHVAFAIAEAEIQRVAEPTALLMGALGMLLSAKALYSEAEQWERRALAIDEQVFGSESTQVALRLNNLAQTLDATNRLSEAEPLMRRALAIDEKSYGAEHPAVARDLNNLALLLDATNRLSEAEPLMRRALAIDEQFYGAEHPKVAIRLNNLALLLKAMNCLSEVEPLMRRALVIDEQFYGAEDPNVARGLSNLAHFLHAANRLAEAEPLMSRAITVFEKSFGEDHPSVATALNNLAQLLQATNRLAEAEPVMYRVVSIFERSLGVDHPNVATALNNLAYLLQITNRLSDAEPLIRRALAIDEQSYGTKHPNVARDLNNLVLLLKATNRLSEADPLMRRALAIDEKSYGTDHPNVARGLNNLALLLYATSRLSEAEPLMRRALAIDEQSYGSEHPNVGRDLNNLAMLLQDTNRLPEAELLMRRAIGIAADFKRRTGHEHPEFGDRMKNYRSMLTEMNLPPDEIDRRVREACGE